MGNLAADTTTESMLFTSNTTSFYVKWVNILDLFVNFFFN